MDAVGIPGLKVSARWAEYLGYCNRHDESLNLIIQCGDSTPILEQARHDSSEDKAADVRQVGHASGLHLRHGARR